MVTGSSPTCCRRWTDIPIDQAGRLASAAGEAQISLRRPLHEQGAFELQKEALGPKAAGIAGETAVAADDAVTRYDDGHRITPIRAANRPNRLGLPDPPGYLAVRCRRAPGDFLQFLPYLLLERRSCRRYR